MSTSRSRDGLAHTSASTAREVEAEPSLFTFDPTFLAPKSEWRDLSDGGYSEVYRAKMLGLTVAVKQATSRKKTAAEALLREIRYLSLAGAHPNLVTAYGAFEERGRLHLVLEFAQCLRNDRVARTCDPIVVFSGVARALVHLHGIGILHRDLKARNVLVAADNRPLLIDFGLACHTGLDSAEWVCRTVGTKKYRPPEMRECRPAQPSMDVYCVGLMIEKLLKQRRELLLSPRSLSEERGVAERGAAERGDVPDRVPERGLERGGDRDRRDRDWERDREREREREGREGGSGLAVERRMTRLLHEIAEQCTRRDPVERPAAWAVLTRLQRFAEQPPSSRCEAPRQSIPLSATHAALLLQAKARAMEAEYDDADGGRSRKRRRGDGADDGRGRSGRSGKRRISEMSND